MGELPLLLWKNWTLRKRNVFSAISEIVLPLLFIFLLVWLQTLDKDKDYPERDWTCPTKSAFSPTLLDSPYLEQKVADETKDDDFFFSVNTANLGTGIQTVPPFIYLLTLCAKTEAKLGLVSLDPESRAWFQEFVRELDESTKPLEHPLWQGLHKVLGIFEIPFCKFSRLVVYFDSRKELDEYVTSKEYGTGDWNGGKNGCPLDDNPEKTSYKTTKPKIYAAVELSSKENGNFEYALRFNMSVVPPTYPQIGFVDPLLRGINPEFQDNYLLSGFTTLQLQMDRHLIGKKVKKNKDKLKSFAEHSICDSLQPIIRDFAESFDKPNLNKINCIELLRDIEAIGLDLEPLIGPASYIPNQIRIAPFPTPDYVDRPFYKKVEGVISLLLILCYLWPTSRLIRSIVHEKESRLRENMLQMGVSLFNIMISHLITYGIVFTSVAFFITLITRLNVFSESDPFCVFLFFFLFGCNVVSYSFFISVLFDRAKTASTAGVSLFFIAYMPFFAVDSENASANAKSAACILAPTAFGIGTTVLSHYESSGEGVHWYNAHNAPTENDLPFSLILWKFVMDFFLYLFLGWYFNQVLQSEFGVKKPWYFLCSLSYWRSKKKEIPRVIVDEHDEHDEEDHDPSFFEKPTPDLIRLATENRCVTLKKLRKEFDTPSGLKVAVNNLDLTFYEGEICVLLAPNGGGKSTTIRMLTGDIPPTSGMAHVFGKNVFENMDELRKTMGVCPQHDCLWEDMTVTEHLQFVGTEKGLHGSQLDAAVEEQIRLVGMESKAHAFSKSLSGGQKRKLSLAMALIGNSKLLFLDEPTSGMDSHSRRFVWNLLQTAKAGRIILLTTHFLDEADALGDRIVIMADGRLKCSGTSHFLKQKYGIGYTLTVIGGQNQVKQIVSKHLPDSKLLSAMGTEVSFQVPFQAASAFPAIFNELDQKKARNEIEGYGVSVTTLDEVFVKVALNHDTNWAKAEEDRMLSRRSSSFIEEENFEPSTFATQFFALISKRTSYAKRDRRSVCCNILIPIVLLILGLSMLKAFPFPEPPELILSEKDALQMKNLDNVQTVLDSTYLSNLIPRSFVIDSNYQIAEENNCTEDDKGRFYYHGKEIKRMSTYLRETRYHENFQAKVRFGAIHLENEDELVTATIFANSTAMHSTAIYLNVLNQALLQKTKNQDSAVLIAKNAPFLFTSRFKELLSTFSAVSASISIVMAFSFIPASIAVFVVREREISAKHQQLLAGTGLIAYWTSNYVFDLLMFLIPWVCSLICVNAFGIDAFKEGDAIFAVGLLFAAYGFSIIPFTYLTSFFFHSHSTAQNVVLLLNFITGLVLTIAAFVMSVLEKTHQVNQVLEYFYRIFPGFCLGNGLLNLTVNQSKKTFGDGVVIKPESPFAWDVVGSAIFYMIIESFVYFTLTLLIDFSFSDPFVASKWEQWTRNWKCLSWRKKSGKRTLLEIPLLGGEEEEEELDEDVKNEIIRIDSKQYESDIVVVKHLRKVYQSSKLVAVNDLTFGIKRGDVFALLGVNGSGKSTTLKMLSGEILPTSGTATLDGLDILMEQARVRRMIGYCPQFDALLDLLTVREHLELFGKLKGVPKDELDTKVKKKMTELRLLEFEHRLAGTLSGGNKRKLSVAIALIGDPPLILADEPTTGVDALNRRFLCDVIADYSIRKSKGAVVLTTHSMEEVEALGTRIGILSAGKFKCLGSIQHLKNRFGKGIVFRVRLSPPLNSKVDEIFARIENEEINSEDTLSRLCTKLGNSSRFQQFHPNDPTGWVVYSALERDGHIEPRFFSQYWVSQDDSDKLEEFIHKSFPTAELLEKRPSQFAYRLLELNESLGTCFAIFEKAKLEFNVQEYSVAGTSLESIFIALAQQAVDKQHQQHQTSFSSTS